MTMTGINFASCFLVIFLAGDSRATSEDYCADLYDYGYLQYTTSTKQCCKPKLKHSCEYKAEQVCKDVMEVECEPQARVECRSETMFVNGKKCQVEFKDYDYKDCNKKITTRIDCKRVSVDTCKPKLKIYEDGRAAFAGETTCTPLFYEDCVVVDDIVGGCSRDELDTICSCTREYVPVCAGGKVYNNLCLYECAKREAECAAVQGFPAVGNIDECVDPGSKGILNRDAIKDFKELCLSMEADLAKLASSSSSSEITQIEYDLLLAIVKAKEYVLKQCSIINGQCDLAKIVALMYDTKSKFYAVKSTGTVSTGCLQKFTEERKKFVVVCELAEKVQEKLAVKPKDCTCSDFTNNNGIGKCQKRVKIGTSVAFGGHVACYVNLPTSCPDAVQSQTNPGLYLSAEACDCAHLDPNNAVALDSCGLVPLGRAGSNRLEGIRARRSAPTAEPTCTTPFQIKWADYVQVDKELKMLDTVCEAKISVECKKVSVKKCTQVDWKECSLRPVQECEAVLVSQPTQEKSHQKKCFGDFLDDDSSSSSSSRSRSHPSRGSSSSGSSQSSSSSRNRAGAQNYPSGAQVSRAAQDYPSGAQASRAAQGYASGAQASRAAQGYPSGAQASRAAQDYPSGAQGSQAAQGYPSGAQVSRAAQGYPSGAQVSRAVQDYASGAQVSRAAQDYPPGAQASRAAQGYPSGAQVSGAAQGYPSGAQASRAAQDYASGAQVSRAAQDYLSGAQASRAAQGYPSGAQASRAAQGYPSGAQASRAAQNYRSKSKSRFQASDYYGQG